MIKNLIIITFFIESNGERLAIAGGSTSSSSTALMIREDNLEVAQVDKAETKASTKESGGFRRKKKVKTPKEKMPKVCLYFKLLIINFI